MVRISLTTASNHVRNLGTYLKYDHKTRTLPNSTRGQCGDRRFTVKSKTPCGGSEPALIYVIISFLLRLNKVKYHWSKSGKGEKIVNLIFFMKRGQQNNKKAFFLRENFINNGYRACMSLWKRFDNFPKKSGFLIFSAMSGVEIKTLQRSEQALFYVSRLPCSISRVRLATPRICYQA